MCVAWGTVTQKLAYTRAHCTNCSSSSCPPDQTHALCAAITLAKGRWLDDISIDSSHHSCHHQRCDA
ncbi:hypothetical protein RSAG8_03948, partial [Rhizoctonia solani AG-8 WAC10335]